ncbi:hypothetical protein LIER_32135 [Lithospermum erythrorhizon]|uniref:DYW domain-containing protein n=1 Tax=Lithospermum erythrorhizon TaxID=34254 RepID=A0AAV3RX09_LITER
MLRAYYKINNSFETIKLFQEMMNKGHIFNVFPDDYSFNFVITSCAMQMCVVHGEVVHGMVVKYGYGVNLFVGNSLVNLYGVFGKMEEAWRVFDEMPKRDVVSWTCLVSGYAKKGDMDRACEIFGRMPVRNEVSWAVMISGFVGSGRYAEAIEYFGNMLSRCKEDNVRPNEAVLVCALSACAHLGALDQGNRISGYIFDNGMSKSSNIRTALIDMYAKCGQICSARRVFDDIVTPDVHQFTSMITGLSINGLGKEALRIFDRMLNEKVKPNEVTILGVLKGCSHSGLVKEGSSIFYNMDSSWGIMPKIEHYGCYVDLLGRAGYLEKAFGVIKSMPLLPDIIIWRALLSACRVHRNVCLAERIVHQIEPHKFHGHSEGQVLLSNLYSSLGKWEKVDQTRKQMGDRKTHMDIGCSWIEVNSVIHEFRVADQMHSQIMEIREKLDDILEQASLVGYVANTSSVSFDLNEEDKEKAVAWHSEKLAVAFGLMTTTPESSIRIVKNLRTCEDCHLFLKAVSVVYNREIIVRDRCRFHTFRDGNCSCNDYW